MKAEDEIKKTFKTLSGIDLDREIKRVNDGYVGQKLHHYQNQPNVRKMRQEVKARRREVFDKIVSICCVVGAVLAVVILVCMVILAILIKKGLEI